MNFIYVVKVPEITQKCHKHEEDVDPRVDVDGLGVRGEGQPAVDLSDPGARRPEDQEHVYYSGSAVRKKRIHFNGKLSSYFTLHACIFCPSRGPSRSI